MSLFEDVASFCFRPKIKKIEIEKINAIIEMTRLIVAMSMYYLFDAKSIAEFADYKELNLVYLLSDPSLRINLPAEKAT